MPIDMIRNGTAFGSVASRLLECDMDPNCLRPYIGRDGNSYITVVRNGKPKRMRTNATATLPYDAWKHFDGVVEQQSLKKLKYIGAKRGAGLELNIPDGMGTTVLQYQRRTRSGTATISMDGLRKGNGARPTYDTGYLPLPIIHEDFGYTLREIAVSRRTGQPLDTTQLEDATRTVSETAEQLALGFLDEFSYGGGTIYGLGNFPSRHTKDLADPTDVGWIPNDTFKDVQAMKQTLVDDLYTDECILWVGSGWGQYLDEDYSAAKGDITLRDRILKINGISAVETLDYLDPMQMILETQLSGVARIVVGMEIQSFQWEGEGGFEFNYKVGGIIVPQIREEVTGKVGFVDGNVA